MPKYSRPKLYVLVIIVLLLSVIIYNLGVSSYITREGITAQEIKDNAEQQTNANIQKNKPQPEQLPKNFDISVLDVKDYQPLDLANSPVIGNGQRIIKKVPRFIEKFPNQKYLISSTTEDKINTKPEPKMVRLGDPTIVTIPTETSKFNSFIVIAPDNNSIFPPEFKVSINNRQSENGIQTWLWGFSITKTVSVTNGIINGDPLKTLPYNKKAFTVDVSGGLTIAGVNIGNNAINAVEVNSIPNKRSVPIGNVTSSNSLIEITCSIPTDKLTGEPIEKITGILVYLGFPDK